MAVYGVTWGEGDGPGGSTVTVNATGTSGINLNDSLPAAPADGVNVRFQIDAATDPDNISANVPTATSAVVLATTSGSGSASSVLRTDAQIAVFDGGLPGTLTPSTAAAAGTTAKAARRDHVHAINVVDEGSSPSSLSNTPDPGTGAFASPYDHIHKSQTNGDWYAEATGKGMVTKDTQATPRYWRLFVKEGATVPASGGVTITISSTGVITATRDGSAAGDVVIRIDDTGTAAP